MLIKREAFNLLVLTVALVVCTVAMTERSAQDWRYAGSVLLAYLVFVGLQWVWDQRRGSREG